jgi:pyridoxal phosphate phosphatase PHOSPHO2
MIAAFDFDHTIIDVNSDTYINKLLIECEEKNNGEFKFSSSIEEIYQKHGWTKRMQAVFDLMHEKYKIGEDQFVLCLKEIKIKETMKKLFYLLKEKNYELFIISDANTIFIETILRENGLDTLFNMQTNIFTNRAYFEEQGRIKLVPFVQIYNLNGQSFDCPSKICAKNICKGVVYKNLVEKFQQNNNNNNNELLTSSNLYVGDGTNDFCPGLFLNPHDKYFVKKNFSLAKRLANPRYSEQIKCKIFYWNDAQEIIENL